MSELDYLTRQVARHRMGRREFLGRASALGLGAVAATSLYGRTLKAATPNKGGHLVLGLVGGESSNSLDPALWASQVPYTFGKCWAETLIMPSPVDASPMPGLAESWEGSADVKTWVLNIRKGVTFHNGKELTGADVVATFERHADEKSQSGALGLLADFESVTADGNTVTIKLSAPNADLPLLISDYHLMIQPNGGKDQPDAGIGTGPYKVEVTEHGVRYVGVKNPDYWNNDVGHFESVEVLTVNDATARMAALQAGQVHMVNRVAPATADLLKRAPGLVVNNTPGRGHYVFNMHCDTAPFDNLDLRLALKYALDRDALVENVLQGYGTAGNDFPINAAYDLFPDSIEQRVYDPDKAAFHYKKSGHSGAVVFRTSDVAFPGAIDAAVLYQQSAAKAGITLDVVQEPGDGYWNNVWNVQPFAASYWSGRATQDGMYSTAHVSTAEWNDTRFFRPDFDALITEARGELDREKRKELYTAAARIVRDEGGVIVAMFNDWIDAFSDRIQGYKGDPGGELENNYAPIRCWFAA